MSDDGRLLAKTKKGYRNQIRSASILSSKLFAHQMKFFAVSLSVVVIDERRIDFRGRQFVVLILVFLSALRSPVRRTWVPFSTCLSSLSSERGAGLSAAGAEESPVWWLFHL